VVNHHEAVGHLRKLVSLPKTASQPSHASDNDDENVNPFAAVISDEEDCKEDEEEGKE